MNNLQTSTAAPAEGAPSVVDGLAEFRQLAGMSGFVGGYGATANIGTASSAPIGGFMTVPGITSGGAAGMNMGMAPGAIAMGSGRTAEEEQLLFSLLRERSGLSGVSTLYGAPGVGAGVVPNPSPLLGSIGLGGTGYDHLPRVSSLQEPMAPHQPSLNLMRDLQGTGNMGTLPPVGMGNFLLEQQRSNGLQINPGLQLNPATTTPLDMNFVGMPTSITAATNFMPQPILTLPQKPPGQPEDIEYQEDIPADIPADRKMLETEDAPVQEDLFDDDDEEGSREEDDDDEILDPDPLPTPERKIVATARTSAYPMEKQTKKRGKIKARSLSAFKLFSSDEKERILNDWNSKSDITTAGIEHGKKPSSEDMEELVGDRWQALSDDWKKYYQDLADAEADSQKKGKKRSRKIDANAPRRPPTAFLLFSNKRRKALKMSKPDATNADLSRLLSKTWREAPDKIRQKYLDESAEMAAVYKEEMLAYKAREREQAGLDQGESRNYDDRGSLPKFPPAIIRPAFERDIALEKEPLRKHRKKDPNAPKRPLSAFLAYSNARRKELKRRYPDSTNADLSKMLSKMWKKAPEEFRHKYIDEAARRSSVYKEEMAKWKAEQEASSNL